MECAVQKRSCLTRFMSLVAVFMLVLAMPFTVMADDATDAAMAAAKKVSWNSDGTLSKTNGGFSTGSISLTLQYPYDNTKTANITVTPDDYQKLLREYKKLEVQNKVNDAMGNIDVVADTGAAQELMGGIQPIIELFCGVIVYMIVLGLPVFTCLDILYITYPVFRNGVQGSAQNGGMMSKTRKDGSTGVKWISDEAQFAVETANLGEGSSALMIYTKKRFIVYILCSLMIFIFLTGNIQIFTNLAVQVVSGIISVIQGMVA